MAFFPSQGRACPLFPNILAFVLEPTDSQIQLGCVGSITAKASILGKSGHSARPWEGKNAIHKAWKLMQFLAEKKAEKVSLSGIDFYKFFLLLGE